MSYIRSTSNPEGLYIWGDKDTIFIVEGHKPAKKIPKVIFHGLIRNFHKNYHEDSNFKGASIKEVWVKSLRRNEPKLELSYDGWKITMWEVTWVYIAYTNLENINRNLRKNKIVLC